MDPFLRLVNGDSDGQSHPLDLSDPSAFTDKEIEEIEREIEEEIAAERKGIFRYTDALVLEPCSQFREMKGMSQIAEEDQNLKGCVCVIDFELNSTVVLYMLALAFGRENVTALYMKPDFRPFTKLNLPGVNFLQINFERFASEAPHNDGSETYRHDLETAVARNIARERGALFVTAMNKTDYFTQPGLTDALGHVQPLLHLYKTQVRQFADWLLVPNRIKKDRNVFLEQVVDLILHYCVDRKLDRDQICAEFAAMEGFPIKSINRIVDDTIERVDVAYHIRNSPYNIL